MTNSRRTYTLRKRAQTTEETRIRIIEAACTLLRQAGYPQISLDDLARTAGVSRQTIYVQFGSKSGVLQAVAEYIEQVDLANLMPDFLAAPDPVAALRLALDQITSFFECYTDVLRTLQAQTIYDPDFAGVWQARQQEIWRNTRRVVEQLGRAGRLTPVWTVDSATDWLWALSSFEFYTKVVTERGWRTEQYVQMIMHTIAQVMLMPAP